MRQELITALGFGAGALTTACWVPQVLRSARTRSTTDLSWPALCTLLAGVSLWLTYGLLQHDLALMGANSGSLVALLTLAHLKRRCD